MIESDYNSDSVSTSIDSTFPTPTLPPSSSSIDSIEPMSPTPPPPSKRRILPSYKYEDGSWIIDTGWTLRGSTPTLKPYQSRRLASALADNVDSTASFTLIQYTASPTSASPSSAAQPTRTFTYAQHAYANASEVPIPRGWQPRPRETDYFAVPIIIAMSVLVAIIVVGAILGSVCWRKKKRRRRDPEKDIQEKGWRGVVQRVKRGGRTPKKRKRKVKKSTTEVDVVPRASVEDAPVAGDVAVAGDNESLRESIGSTGSGNRTPRIVRTTGFTAVTERSRPRWRGGGRRRRNVENDGTGDEDEQTALTRSDTRSTTSSAGVRDTLTARLTARLRGSNDHQERSSPSTVFSRNPERNRSSSSLSNDPFPRTSTQDTQLTRSTSRSSLYTAAPPPLVPPPSILFTPADDPTLSPGPPGSPAFAPISLAHTTSRSFAPSPSPALSTLEATDPLLPAPPAIPTSNASNFNALLSHDADLGLPLMPGPPAYRPASSSVQTTRRYGAGDAPRVAPSTSTTTRNFIGRRRRSARERMAQSGSEDLGEGDWHWPGEKGDSLIASSSGGGASSSQPSTSTSTSTSPFALTSTEEDEEQEEEEQEEEEEVAPPLDRSMYQAHLATDDKSVLHRLRNGPHRDEAEGSGSSRIVTSEVPSPSAPPVVEEEEDLDEDGFERFNLTSQKTPEPEYPTSSSEKSKLRSNSHSQLPSTLLPAPPSRVSYAYLQQSSTPTPAPSTSKSALAAEYAALHPPEQEEELDLPVYLPQEGRRNETLGMASAPPITDDDDEEDEEEEEEGVTHATI